MEVAPVAPPKLYRICLLVNGYFTKNLLNQNGDYVAMYSAWLQASLPKHSNIRFEVIGFETQKLQYPKRKEIDGFDAVLVSGSPEDAYSDAEWVTRLLLFLQEVGNNHPKIRIYGICFGHQIVCRSLGAVVEPNGGRWETGLTKVNTTYMGKLLWGVESMNLMQFHQDHVILDSLADYFTTGELYLLGATRRTDCQGVVKFYPYYEQTDRADELVNRVHIMTTQGHPEFTEQIVTEILRQRHEKGTITDDAHQEYFGTKGHLSETEPVIKNNTGLRWQKHYDGVRVIGRTFWRMLGVSYGDEHPPKVPA
ncbi:Putative glutamine amidotransferase-like protein C13C5.04 [Leucoagaricus sp. SymC.cos]|nr:Putative glutamine amidotransferase-like protein C13C5.04 [Leucoagaricus sp. SymC.cos]